ncbi:MAG: right-handed parallel beta-helix repeat-containing protein [Ignavibacteriaceae bacterium]|nr:right-handed parallel beta-helix repeat-containing protein [Ignavibacteriaceae bacterium]
MINSISKILIILLLLFSSCAERDLFTDPLIDPSLGGTYTKISGTVFGVLSKSDSPFLVSENLNVEENETLTIESGVLIFFKDGVSFNVNGKLDAIGTKDFPITFTAFLNDWEGIHILSQYGNSKFKFCTFEKVFLDHDNPIKYGAISIASTVVEFKNCVFQNNYSQFGGALAIESANVKVTNCIFYNNEAVVYGGAILSEKSSNKIINNTFYKNFCLNYGGGIVLVDPVNEEIQNNILFDNRSYLGDPRIEIVSGDSSNIVEQFNFLAFDEMDPLFISSTDFHLSTNSPCIDVGNPEPEYNDVNGTRNDQGAYGGPEGDW